MTDCPQHPIIPPTNLIEKWYANADNANEDVIEGVAVRAARWGADLELEACCEWLNDDVGEPYTSDLRAARRPEPPSLKQQALEALEAEDDRMPLRSLETGDRFDLIRRALESIPDDL